MFDTTGALYFYNAYFSQGTGPIQLDNVQCTGNEQTILQCSHSTIDNCGHSQDAGIRCRGKITSSSFVYKLTMSLIDLHRDLQCRGSCTTDWWPY